MNKPVESVIVKERNILAWDSIEADSWTEEDIEDYEKLGEKFIDASPSNFYILLATGDRCYYKTRDRLAAQKQADEDWGKGKYTIRCVKDQKNKSKLESGGLSCSGSNSRRGMGQWLRKS